MNVLNLVLAFFLIGDFTLTTINQTDEFNKEDELIEPTFFSETDNQVRMYGDMYEYNDTLSNAINLSPDNFYELDEYKTSIDASLHTDGQSEDIDFFYFSIFTDSFVSISASTLTEAYSFNFFISKYEYNTPSGNDIGRRMINVIQDTSGEKNKFFSSVLTPGTYFIYFMCQQPWNSYITVDYSLNLCVKKTLTEENFEISDLRFNKDLSGAVWLSDYLPFGMNNIFNPLTNLTYQDKKTNMNDPDYALDNLLNISNGEDIHIASVYIWGSELRYCIQEVLQELCDELIDTFLQEEHIRVELETKFDNAKNIIKVTGFIIKMTGEFVPFGKIISSASSLVSAFSIEVLDYIFNMITTNITTTTLLYTSYLNRILGAVAIKPEITHDTNKNLYYSFPKYNEIIELPFYYKLYKQHHFLAYDTHHISFEPSLTHYLNNSIFYKGKYLISDPTDSYYCRGKIYGLKSNFSTKNDLVLAKEINNVQKKPISLKMNMGEVIPSLLTGEYIWFEFQADSTKEYFFLVRGEQDIRIDLFDSSFTGYSNDGLIESHYGKYVGPDKKKGCYFSKKMNNGQKVYIRVEGNNFSFVQNPSVIEIFDSPQENEYHIHVYNKYIWQNVTQHALVCECGARSHLENHVVKAGGKFCLSCGGSVDKGFIIDYSLNHITSYYSYSCIPAKFEVCNFSVILKKEE